MAGDDIRTDIDRKIIDLISERAALIIDDLRKKGEITNAMLFDVRHELFTGLGKGNYGPLPDEIIRKIYSEILLFAFNFVKPLRIAFLGPEGTFTSLALREFFSDSIKKIPEKTIPDVFHTVESGAAEFGVVPVENSTEGAVTFTMDELIETDLNIVAEKFIRISYCLVSKNRDMQSIKKLYSHPQPLGQCKEWLRKNLPDVETIHADSTSRAAELASGEADAAAISSSAAAELYSLNVLSEHIEDLRQNYTRFFAIGRGQPAPTGNDRTSIICALKDKPGALLSLITPLCNSGLNMTKIESRPDKKKMWEYNFFIDFYGHMNDKTVKETLEIMKNEAVFLKILGSYSAGK